MVTGAAYRIQDNEPTDFSCSSRKESSLTIVREKAENWYRLTYYDEMQHRSKRYVLWTRTDVINP